MLDVGEFFNDLVLPTVYNRICSKERRLIDGY